MISKKEFIYEISTIKSKLKSLLDINEIYNSELCLDVSMMYLESIIPDLYKYPETKNMIEDYITQDKYDINSIYSFYVNEIGV